MTTEYRYQDVTFGTKVVDHCALVTLQDGAFSLGTNLEEKERFLTAFDDFEASPDIHAILIFNEPESLGDVAHRQFVSALSRTHDQSRVGTHAPQLLAREENALDEFVLRATESKKLLVSCLRGQIATPFFGVSLASDLRLAAPDMSFSLSHIALGVPPTGALAFLLPRFVGQGRATEMLLKGGTVSAARALELGLIHEVVTELAFRAGCVEAVGKVIASFPETLPYSRALLYPYVDELRAFLGKEAKVRSQTYNDLGR